jgi:hypothetical protein
MTPPQSRIFFPVFPEKGKVYCIREVQEVAPNCPVQCLYFVGIQSYNNEMGMEMGFNSMNFRLLSDVQNQTPDLSGEYDFLKGNE